MGFARLHRRRARCGGFGDADAPGISVSAPCGIFLCQKFRKAAHMVYQYKAVQEKSRELCAGQRNDPGNKDTYYDYGHSAYVFQLFYYADERGIFPLPHPGRSMGVPHLLFFIWSKNPDRGIG